GSIMRLKYLAAGLLSLCAASVWADARQNIAQSLERLQFPVPISAVSESPVEGLHQVQLENGKVIYATADGRHLIQGVLLSVEAEQARQVLAALPTEQLVVFAPEQPKTHITVFTDVDCGYCRKLHEEVGQLNDLGIEVRYAAFPRAGLQSATARTMQSVWCAD